MVGTASIHFRFCDSTVDTSCTNTSRGYFFIIYIYISCVSYIFRPPLTRMYIFHRLFFCRVVNHEDASRIRTKVACLRYLRILSFPKLYSLLPWKGRRLIPRFWRWIKTKKNLKNILLSFVESNILDKSLYVFIPYLYIYIVYKLDYTTIFY